MESNKRITDIVQVNRSPFGAPYVFVLAVIKGHDQHVCLRLTQKETTIGADPDLADLALRDNQISNRHLLVRINGNMVSIIDLESTNGTVLNKNKISSGKPHRLKHLDEIQIGRNRLLFMACRFHQDT
ncbi:MAG: FHA domain-containing protein [Deltaproteobacteria bacterium]|nr:FHA domain-containing protein [Deltaproteobacteria bacterium]